MRKWIWVSSITTAALFVGIGFLALFPSKEPEFDAFMKGHEALNMGRYDVAVGFLEPLAMDGDKRAQDYLGLIEALGLGRAVDRDKAAYWIAQEEGRGFSECSIARYWATDTFEIQDFGEAAFWVSAADDARKESFCLNLLAGDGVEEDVIRRISSRLD